MSFVPGWRNAYDQDESVIYLLDLDLRIVRCNPAWDRFALANDGASASSAKVSGSLIMSVVPAVLQPFYATAYANVRRFQREWWHVFECSSPTRRRTFHMRILPCESGLLTINTLFHEGAFEDQDPSNVEDYSEADGIVVMCSHCRRVKSVRQDGRWDWVPEMLLRGNVMTKAGLCEFCSAYHNH